MAQAAKHPTTSGPRLHHRCRAYPALPAVLLLALVTTALTACGSGRGFMRPTQTVLTEDEIGASTAHTAFEAVQRLRPQFLRARGQRTLQRADSGEPVIYVDNIRTGGIDALRTIRATEVSEIRYLSPTEATTRYGTGHLGGVIAVVLRRS